MNHDQLAELLAALDGLRTTIVASLDSSTAGTSDDPIVDLMLRSQALVLTHPAAAAGVVDSLAELGRRHAATAEGAALVDALTRSEAVADLRTAWEAITLNLLDGATTGPSIPAAWIDLMLDGVSAEHVAASAEALRPEGFAG